MLSREGTSLYIAFGLPLSPLSPLSSISEVSLLSAFKRRIDLFDATQTVKRRPISTFCQRESVLISEPACRLLVLLIPSSVSPFNHLSKPDAGLFIPDIPASCPRQQPARHRPRTNACTRHFIQHDPPSKSHRTTEASPFNKPRPTLLRTRTSSPSSYKGGDTQFLCARRHARPSRVLACRRGL